MRKKWITLLLAAVMTCSLAGCGQSPSAPESTTEAGKATEAPGTAAAKAEIEKYLTKTDESFAYEIAETLAYDEKYLSNEMGWRTAGSDAEHAAAEYLQEKMKEIGLEDIEAVPVTVDKWQFNDASLTIEGTDIDIMPASYATNGTDEDGLTAEIVDVGTGLAADYEGLDVEGKIVLAGVDQWNEAWIDLYMNEAHVNKAAAIVTYDIGGYATYSDDMINMQDVCDKDLMPCVSISKNQYNQIKEALDAGNNMATLIVDNEMVPEGGTSYNVIGKIPGKSSAQQMIISGHYDVYFNGFQDDSCAIGLILGIGKAMKDAGYVPQNDIVFVCHGSEEWGATGTQFDWTTGAWEMINNAHPEWAEKTIAMLNFEIPAFYDGAEKAQMSCVPEFASLVREFVGDSGLCPAPVNDVYPGGVDAVSVDTNCMEDGVSYRASGVPYFIDIPGSQDGEDGWIQQRYHTVKDDKDTYNADVMATNINMYGALAIYVDRTPALKLDLTAACEDLKEGLNEEIAGASGVDAAAYGEALKALTAAAENYNQKIQAVNDAYAEALENDATEEALTVIYEEGAALNKTTLELFKYVQNHFVGILLSSDIVTKHTAYQNNIEILEGVAAALEKGELVNEEETGAVDLAYNINAGAEYGFYSFSEEANAMTTSTLLEKENPCNLFWGTDKGFVLADTSKATTSLLGKMEAFEKGEELSFEEELSIYNKALKKQKKLYKEAVEKETAAMETMTEMLNKN